MTRFDELYAIMAKSNEVENMELFGDVMRCAIKRLSELEPTRAKEYVDRLESIKWNNYLTKKEADAIVKDMTPSAPWTYEVWKTAMDTLGFDTHKEPHYNEYALWCMMNMVYSDSAKTIASIVGKPLDEIEPLEFARYAYMLAVDKLTDEDGVFDIRKYFDI